MALKAILDTLDDAPEAVRSEYEERDGKFYLSVEPVGGYALEDVTGLKTALGKERTTREQLEKSVVKFKDLDPERARAALAELEELKRLDPNAEADKIANTKFEAAKAQLLEKHGQEIGQRDERIGKLTGSVDKLVRRSAAVQAIAEAKGSVELLLPHVLANTRVKESDDGEFTVEIIDKAGNVRIGNSKGEPMTLTGLLAEMRETEAFGRAFDGEGQSGSGKQHDNAGSGHRGPTGNWGGSTEERKAAIAKKFGLKE